LNDIPIRDASVPVVVNVTAEPETNKEAFQEKLIEQLYSPVLWEDTVQKLINLDVDTFVEIGPGKVLSGLVRKVDRQVRTISVQDPESCQQAIELLRGESV
ncbi:ACP S-malonyltransferase, partial [Enterococcus faecalis]|nr:ACP S-malonyltransferase [Enterococcus faecalis]